MVYVHGYDIALSTIGVYITTSPRCIVQMLVLCLSYDPALVQMLVLCLSYDPALVT